MSMTRPLACELQYIPLSPQFLPDVLAVEREAYVDPWSEHMFLQELSNRVSHFHVALHGGQLVGYVGFWLVLDEAHVTKVTVAQPYRGLGLGAALMEHLFQWAEELGAVCIRLEVRESNSPARGLYCKFGFKEVRVRSGYYARTHENAIEMARLLGTASADPQDR